MDFDENVAGQDNLAANAFTISWDKKDPTLSNHSPDKAAARNANVVLDRFQPKVILDLGKTFVGKSVSGAFVLSNPQSTPVRARLSKYPVDDFSFEDSEWTLDPSTTVEFAVEWTPSEQGKIRHMFEFEILQKRKVLVQAVVLGEARHGKQRAGPRKSIKPKDKDTHALKESTNRVPFRDIKDNKRSSLVTSKVVARQESPDKKPLRLKKAATAKVETDVRFREGSPLKQQTARGRTGAARAPLGNIRTNSKGAVPPPGTRPSHRTSVASGVAAKPVNRTLRLRKSSGAPKNKDHASAASGAVSSKRVIHYDERWQEKQEHGFSSWINYIVIQSSGHPSVDGSAQPGKPEMVAAGPEAPSGGSHNAHAILAQKQREAAVRRRAFRIYHSDDVESVLFNVEKEIARGGLLVRSDRQMYKDLGLRNHVMTILSAYHPVWLRIGLETIFGEVITITDRDLHRDGGRSTLNRFLVERFLSDPEITARYRDTKRGVFENKQYSEELQKFTLNKFLMVVAFLDQAKLESIVDHPACLFEKNPKFNPLSLKSSTEVVIEFAKEFLSGEGNVLKHLLHSCGYQLFHKQTVLDEFDFTVNNLAVDLRDGVRMTRVVEILTSNFGRSLSKKLRIPAVSRLQKLHNVSLALDQLESFGIDLGAGKRGKITKNDIVDGNRAKTLALLWKMIVKWRLSDLVSMSELKDEIAKVSQQHGPTAKKLLAQSVADAQLEHQLCANANEISDRGCYENENNAELNEIERLLLNWCQVVCAHHGGQVSNFTTSFATGRNLCYLVHQYHPKLLQIDQIHMDTADGDKARFRGKRAEYKQALEAEHANFRLVNQCAMSLGCVPILLPDFDSENVPEAKLMSVFIAYLCARLFDARKEIHAAMVIQKRWLAYYYKKHAAEKGSAARVIQKCFRGMLGRKAFGAKLQAKLSMAAVVLQALVRKALARSRARAVRDDLFRASLEEHLVLRLRLIEKENRVYQLRNESATAVQACWRMFKAENHYLDIRFSVVTLQSVGRRFIAQQDFNSMQRSIVKLQSVARLVNAQRHRADRQHAIVALQSTWRGCAAAREYQIVRGAVVTLQAFHRTVAARNKFLHDHQAIVLLQSYARMRKHVSAYATTQRAALKLQSTLRTYLAMESYLHVRYSVVKTQAFARAAIASARFTKTLVSVRVIQRFLRAVKARQIEHQRVCACRLQAMVRGYNARKEWLVCKSSAVVLQTTVRGFQARTSFASSKAAIVKIQARARMLNAAQVASTRKRAVRIIHRFAVVVHCKLVLERANAASKIASVVRMRREKDAFVHTKKSAVVIQARVRSSIQKTNYATTRRAIVTLQSVSRSLIAQNQRKKSQQAALQISSWWRAMAAQAFVARLRATVKIQAAARSWTAKRDYQRSIAATRDIQRVVRGHLCSLHFQRSVGSITKIQSVVRARQASMAFLHAKLATMVFQSHVRRRFAQKRFRFSLALVQLQRAFRVKRDLRSFQVARSATIEVQRVVRGWFARTRLIRCEVAAVTMQAFGRSVILRQHYVHTTECVLVVQSFARMVVAKNELLRHRAARTIQASSRTSLQQKRYAVLLQSVTELQRMLRGYLVRGWYLRVREQLVRVQAFVRMHRCVHEFGYARACAVKIQSSYRRDLEQNRYKSLKASVGILQRVARGAAVRRGIETKHDKACLIQSQWRAHVLTYGYQQKRTFVVRLQAIVRGWAVKNWVARQTANVTTIQGCARRFLAQRQYALQRAAAVKLASFARRIAAEAEFQRLRDASLTLQCAWRCRLAHEQLTLLRAACMIQTQWRKHRAVAQYDRVQGSVIRLQAFARAGLLSKRYAMMRESSIRMQVFVRMQQAKQVAACMREANLEAQQVVVLQRNVRSFLFRQQVATFFARLQQQQECAGRIARWYQGKLHRRRYLQAKAVVVSFQLRLRMRIERKRVYVVDIQRVVRSFLARKRAHCILHAPEIIQAAWRGYLVRAACNRAISEARARIAKANAHAEAAPEMKLGNRTHSAMEWLLSSSSLANVLHACAALEVSTRLSDLCCDVFVLEQRGAPEVMFKLIKSCNRSEPHIKLLRVALAVLTHCANRPRASAGVFAPAECVDILVDLLQIFRDRYDVFKPAAKLLYLMKKRCPQRAMTLLYNDNDLMKRMASIHKILKRKLDIEKKLHHQANKKGEQLHSCYKLVTAVLHPPK